MGDGDRNGDHVDVGSDLRIRWRKGRPTYSGYSYHSKEVIEEQLRVAITLLATKAELLQEWLDAFSGAAQAEGEA